MATVGDIENAMRNAAAAGDKQAVLKLAAARKALLAQQPSQDTFEQRFAKVKQLQAAGQPIPDELSTPDVMNRLTQEFAQRDIENPDAYDYGPEAQKRNAQLARDVESGVPEGLKLIKAGGQQLWGSLQDAYNMFVHGKANRKEEIVTKPDGTRVRVTDLLDSSKEKQAIAQEMIRQQVDEAKAVDAGASKQGRRNVAGAVQIGTLALAPEALPGKATTLIGGMVRNSAAGAASNALVFDAEGGGIGDATIAAGAPPLLGIIPSVSPAIKNWIGRGFARIAAEGRTARRVANMEATLPRTARTLTLAQRTGVPELITLERAATNSKMVNHFADQTDTFVNELTDVLRQPVKPGQTLANDFVNAKAHATKSLSDFRQAASNNYDAGIKEARRIASEGGGGNTIPVQGFRNSMQDVFDEVRGLRARGSKSARDISEPFMRYNENLFSQKQTLNASELADLLVDLSARARSKDPLTRKLAGKMRAALEDDMNKLEDNASFWADDAAKTILETRKEYSRAQKLIGELSDNAGMKLLGVADGNVSPDEALSNFKSFTPEKRAEVRSFLEENSPDLLVTLKQSAIDDAVGHAGIRPGADSQQDLAQLADRLFDPKTNDLRTSGLWNAEELKRIENVKEGMRTIANNRPQVGPAGTPIRPEDVAINAVSQHPAFLSRAIARAIMATKGARFFTDPVIYDRMRVINRSTTGSPTNLMARAALLDYLSTDYLEQDGGQK